MTDKSLCSALVSTVSALVSTVQPKHTDRKLHAAKYGSSSLPQ